MKWYAMLTIASLLSILFLTFHLADDIIRGMASGTSQIFLGADPGRLAVWNAGARRRAIGLHHHPPRLTPWIGNSRHPHDGQGARHRRQHCQVQWSVLLHLDASRARRDRAFSVILSARGL